MHADQVIQHGGHPGLRDPNALESALARPRNRWLYEPSCDLPALAAAYGYGLAMAHAYVDGNKRVAFLALYVFLGLNGLELEASQEDAASVIQRVAAGDLGEEELADWVRQSL